MIVSMLGGRAAEEVIFNEITTGASNDFDQATRIAKAMVVDYGMSAMGPINFGPHQDITDWGKSYNQQNTIAESTLTQIDAEVKDIIDSCYKKSVALITKHKEELKKVAEALIKTESVDEDELIALIGQKPKA